MNANETTIDNNNEKMLAFSVNAFYDIYNTYEKYASLMNNGNTSTINLIDELKMFAKDIGIVKTTAARHALLDEFDILLNAICHRFKVILAIMNEYGNKMVAYHNKLPLPKTEVNKILKQLNFVDYGESETTTGNLCDQHQIEQNFFEMTNKKMNEMSRDVEKPRVEDAKKPNDDNVEVESFPEEDEKSIEASVEEKHEDEDSSKNKKANSSKKTSTRKPRVKKDQKKDSK